MFGGEYIVSNSFSSRRMSRQSSPLTAAKRRPAESGAIAKMCSLTKSWSTPGALGSVDTVSPTGACFCTIDKFWEWFEPLPEEQEQEAIRKDIEALQNNFDHQEAEEDGAEDIEIELDVNDIKNQ